MVSNQMEIFASEKVPKLEVIPELPEAQELIPSGDVVVPELVLETEIPQPEDVFISEVGSKRLTTPSS